MAVETTAPPQTPAGLAGRAVAAYGGAERWRSSETVDARFDCGGLLFNWKRGPDNWRSLHIHCSAHRPQVRIEPFDRYNHAAVLDGHDVRIERPGGDPLEIRYDAHTRFPYGRRLLRWDQIDFAYFLCQALWNYLTLPALLMNEDIAWREVNETTLEARFPKHVPTHTKLQQYHFDPATGLLEQYDYTAETFGQWAKAAHRVTAHDSDDGLVYTSKRRVLPRMPSGKALPGPLLIWADIHSFRLT